MALELVAGEAIEAQERFVNAVNLDIRRVLGKRVGHAPAHVAIKGVVRTEQDALAADLWR